MKHTTIKQLFATFGVEIVGITPFDSALPILDCRARARLPQTPKSVIMAAFPYYVEAFANRNLSYYAVVADYHKVVGDLLQSVADLLQRQFGGEFAPFVDNSPLPEVSYAARAGLGVKGQNHLLITRQYGSFVFLGSIVTNLQPDRYDQPNTDNCLQCGLCQTSCPGNAIESDRIAYDRCASYLSQKRGELTPEQTQTVAQTGLVWGCDLCQTVCPMNHTFVPSPLKAFEENCIPHIDYEEIATLCQSRAFGFRGPKVVQRNFAIWGQTSTPPPTILHKD